MRKLSSIIGIFTFLLSANFLLAQSEVYERGSTEIGLRVGANFGSVNISGLSNSAIDGHNAFTAGLVVRQPIDDKLAITSGIHYKQKGFGIGVSFPVEILGVDMPLGASAVTKMNYIEVPLLLNYTHKNDLGIEPYIEIGPSFGYATSATLNTQADILITINLSSTDLDLSKDTYNRFEVAGQGVAGVKIPYGRGAFDIGLNYTQAFTDSVDDTLLDVTLKNKGFGVFAGFNINI